MITHRIRIVIWSIWMVLFTPYWLRLPVHGQDEPSASVSAEPVVGQAQTALVEVEPESIPLRLGWNLFSFQLTPTDDQGSPLTTIAEILSSIEGRYLVVQGFEHGAKSYYPDLPPLVNTLHTLDPWHGYWIKTNQETVLEIRGVPTAQTVVPLYQGWNLIGFLGNEPIETELFLGSILDKIIIVFAYEADDPNDPFRSYNPLAPAYVNNLTHFKPHLGYWVKASGDCVLDLVGGFLKARIDFPTEGDTVGPQFLVKGTAAGAGFGYYYLEIASQSDSVNWVRVSPDHNEPVESGNLERVNLSTFSEGVYLLRLTVHGTDNFQVRYVVANLNLSSGNLLTVRAPEQVKMGEVIVATEEQYSTGEIGQGEDAGILVSDHRGSFAGWSLTSTFTDFVLSGSDEQVVIPVVNRLTLSPSEPSVIEGDIQGLEAGQRQMVVSPTEPLLLLLAHENYGQGRYAQSISLNLFIPPNPVAGQYQSTLSLTIQ